MSFIKNKLFILIASNIKKLFIITASNINPEIFKRFLFHSIYSKKYNKLKKVNSFQTREDLWNFSLNPFKEKSITLIEFGVQEGYSIKFFSSTNTNKDSSFIGFDSFEGLPRDWKANFPKGSFTTKGKLPKINDERIVFVKGWYQNTLPNFLKEPPKMDNLIVHYDSDIYSSTLFCLLQIDSLKIKYTAIFDDFLRDEVRALSDYQEISGAKVEFLGKTSPSERHYTCYQVSCLITPITKFEV